MTIWDRWVQRSILCGVLLGGGVGCSMVASPPSQIAPTDHAALAAWYEKEAAQLRQKAKDMGEMAKRYQETPQHVSNLERGRPAKDDFIQHCITLGGLYTEGAEEADALSRQHRSMLKQEK